MACAEFIRRPIELTSQQQTRHTLLDRLRVAGSKKLKRRKAES